MGHAVSLYELLVYLRNFFPGLHWQFTGEEITGNRIVIPGLETGDLRNETYTGIVTEICVPPEVLAILEEINTWQEKNAEAVQSPYQSESFGGYSYTKASGSSGSGESTSWKTVFAPRLRIWRKI